MKREKSKMRKTYKFVAVMVGVCAIVMGRAQTESTVMMESSHIRTEANATSIVVANKEKGETIKIINQVTDSQGETWYEVKVNTGTGYVQAELVKKGENIAMAAPSETTAMDPKSGNVKTENVNVRSEASVGAPRVASIGKGPITVTGTATAEDGKEWYQVTFDHENESFEGFIRSDYITFDDLPQEEEEAVEITGTVDEAGEAEEVDEAGEAEPLPEEPTEEAPNTTGSLLVTPMNTDTELNVPAGYIEVSLTGFEEPIRAWQNGEFAIFYGSSSNGAEGWYRLDTTDDVYQRFDEAEVPPSGPINKTIVIVILSIVSIVLLGLVIFLAVKMNDYRNKLDWGDQDDEDDDEVNEVRRDKAKRAWKSLNFLTSEDEDDEEDEEDEEDEAAYEELRARRPVQKSQSRSVQQGQQRPVQQGQQRPVQGQQRPVQQGQQIRTSQSRPIQQGQQRPVQQGQQIRTSQSRPIQQGQQRPVQQGQHRPTQQRPTQQRPLEQGGSYQQRPAQQRPTQQRSVEPRPTRPRPAQQRPIQTKSEEYNSQIDYVDIDNI